ncbi:hypothetical protein, partial [Neisseria gonorrhoeae]|uniref:hypothetical protein n=1 Tax=Neisseria gonorrhoeae TaxID=485 RepID=UPI0027D27E88
LDFIFDISKIFPTILPENGSLHRTVLDGIDRTKRANNDLNILYSGLTKIRTRRRAADSTNSTARRGNAVLVFVNPL